jgi:hypothetical protein
MKNKLLLQTSESTSRRLPLPTAPSNQTGIDVRLLRDEVAKKAYFIYLNQGRPQGRDVQHWLEAEAQVVST